MKHHLTCLIILLAVPLHLALCDCLFYRNHKYSMSLSLSEASQAPRAHLEVNSYASSSANFMPPKDLDTLESQHQAKHTGSGISACLAQPTDSFSAGLSRGPNRSCFLVWANNLLASTPMRTIRWLYIPYPAPAVLRMFSQKTPTVQYANKRGLLPSILRLSVR